jgi:hypothetical protein
MTTISLARGVAFLLTALLLAACVNPNRGEWGPAACSEDARVAVDAGAVAAIYFDKTGQAVGVGEELENTTNTKMCPLPAHGGAGGCPSGFCARTMGGKTYCLRC